MIRARTALRATQIARNSLRLTPRVASAVVPRLFSTTPRRLDAASDAASELVSALKAEQKLELETAEEAKDEANAIFEWAQKNDFQVITSDGNEQVQLVKEVSPKETLRVFFSISDVVNAESLLDEDPLAGADEQNSDLAAEEELETPIRVNIVVEKPNGAVGIEGVVQDDLVLVESVIPYASAELAIDESAEADYTRRQAYQGPPFGVLDPSVQSAVQHYLETRGLDGDFALFVQEFASFRENKEYADWLGKIANIIA